jgi:hypothetical protein
VSGSLNLLSSNLNIGGVGALVNKLLINSLMISPKIIIWLFFCSALFNLSWAQDKGFVIGLWLLGYVIIWLQ